MFVVYWDEWRYLGCCPTPYHRAFFVFSNSLQECSSWPTSLARRGWGELQQFVHWSVLCRVLQLTTSILWSRKDLRRVNLPILLVRKFLGICGRSAAPWYCCPYWTLLATLRRYAVWTFAWFRLGLMKGVWHVWNSDRYRMSVGRPCTFAGG